MRLEINKTYRLAYRRDLGYTLETGKGEFVYRGLSDQGHYRLEPVDSTGIYTLYLFPSEIVLYEAANHAREGR